MSQYIGIPSNSQTPDTGILMNLVIGKFIEYGILGIMLLFFMKTSWKAVQFIITVLEKKVDSLINLTEKSVETQKQISIDIETIKNHAIRTETLMQIINKEK